MLPSVPDRSRAKQGRSVPCEQPAAAPAAATLASPPPGFRDLSLLSAALRPADATPAREGPGEGPAQGTGLGSLGDLSLVSAAPRPADATPALEAPGERPAQGTGLGSAGLAGVVSEAAERLRRAQSGLAAAAEGRDAVRMSTSASSGAGGEGSDPGCEARAARRLSSGSGSPTSRPASAAVSADHAGEPSQANASLPARRGASGGSRTAFDTDAAPGAADMPGAGAPAAAAGARGGVAASTGAFRAPSSDVTLATRDAFDTINAMFRGALPQEAPWQASDPAANPAARVMQPPAAGAVAPSAPEPTVTISTRAAYEALSGMFAGALPHEEARRARAAAPAHAGSQGVRDVRDSEAERVPAPGRASSPGIGAPERTLVIYEDTQYGGARAGGSGGGSREDSPEPPPEDSPEPRAFAPRPRSADERTAGALDVFEDTQFGLAAGAGQGLGVSAAAGSAPRAAASPSLAVYEDTQFMGASSAGLDFAAAAGPAAASFADAPAYEPTQYMSENVAPAAAAARPRRALFGKRQQQGASPDAAAPQSLVLHAAGPGAQAAEAPAAAASTPHQGAAGGPDRGLEERLGGAGLDAWPDDTGDLLQDQENLAPGQDLIGCAGAAARAAAPGVLRDIGGDAAAAMGIDLGGGEDIESPLRRLRLVRAPAACRVCVYCVCMQQRRRTHCCGMLAHGAHFLSCSRAVWAWLRGLACADLLEY